MERRLPGLVLTVAVGLLAAWTPLTGVGADHEEVRLRVEVAAEETGKPIANATVYVKFKEERFLRSDKKHEWSVKTNAHGEATFPPLPEGRVLVQVVAKGWKTYGRYHTLEGPKHVLELKLKKPKKWY